MTYIVRISDIHSSYNAVRIGFGTAYITTLLGIMIIILICCGSIIISLNLNDFLVTLPTIRLLEPEIQMEN